MKGIDLFLGVKAEQTLRDAVRAATDAPEAGSDIPELCPVGQKDWIAGERVESPSEFGSIAKTKSEVLKKLIQLNSHQRIRSESIRVYSVRKPVPVFKDPLPEKVEDEKPSDTAEKDNILCPVCGASVHTYNIQYDPWGNMVGCYLCRGESQYNTDDKEN